MTDKPKKIAIIGTGIAGMSAAWLLNHHGHDVTLFEKNDYIGGHTNTVQEKGFPAIDTGFIVYNEWTYPNLIALFKELNVRTIEADMSYAVSLNNGEIEYSSNALFANPKNRFSPKYYQMIFDLIRFYKTSPKLLKTTDEITLSNYLKKHRYSQNFIDNHLYPMAAAIWSMGTEDIGNFPAQSFIRFFVNHGLFNLIKRPQWFTVLNGSREYVAKITKDFKDKIYLNEAVKNVTGKTLTTDKDSYTFDHIVFACHSDQASNILDVTHTAQKALLKQIPYAPNTAYLHQDENLMPKDKATWASWNSLTSAGKTVSLTYWMNKLQSFIPSNQHYFVSLNPPVPPSADKTIKIIHYEHPVFSQDMDKAQKKIKKIQGNDNLWFCGAWCGYGFHEDGLVSGLKIAESISGKQRPWYIEAEKSSAAINTL
jgi:predicted NAD/FAD-binding protein